MLPSGKPQKNHSALRITLIYALFSVLWIFGSDFLAKKLEDPTQTYPWLQTAKGLLFVFTSAILIGVLLNSALRKLKMREHALQISNRFKKDLILQLRHRQKNNLALLSALIEIKSQTNPHSEGLQIECLQSYLRGISLCYDFIQKEGASTAVNFHSFARQLILELAEASQISLKYESTEKINKLISFENAIHVALLVCEVIMEYPPKSETEVVICEKQNDISLNWVLAKKSSLSSESLIIMTLIKQLSGTFHYEENQQPKIKIEMPGILFTPTRAET